MVLDLLKEQYPNNTFDVIGDHILMNCLPNLRIEEMIRYPIFIACRENRCNYVLKFTSEREIQSYERLRSTGLTPNLIDTWKCYVSWIHDPDRGFVEVEAMLTERYDGTLYDLLVQDLSHDEIKNILQHIAQKSLDLNFRHKIEHGDFHTSNIVYRRNHDTLDFAFIDFELSEYPSQNPYKDLLTLETSFPAGYNVHFEVPSEYREMYLQSLCEAELEDMEAMANTNIGMPLQIHL